MVYAINDPHRDWSFLKGDREAACKNLPILPTRSKYCAITLLNHIDSNRYAFDPKTQISGSAASILRYNVFPKLIALLANAILGIPIIVYVDDFGALSPSGVGAEALEPFRGFCSILGAKLKDPKCSVRHINSFLGLKVIFHRLETTWLYRFRLQPKNRLNGSAPCINLSMPIRFRIPN